MLNFDTFLNLPVIWGAIIATAIFLYVFLDGFDLGLGILFPFAPTDQCRNRMMNSIAPFWDGNETWLVMGGGGLLAAFPLAYATVFPALYIPIITMLLCLILRGVAFEFRYKAQGDRIRFIWDILFHVGSLGAAFAQGVTLGGYIQGINITGRSFSGGAFDWLSSFSLMTGVALVFGYGLLGAGWLIIKTSGKTQAWARKAALYNLGFVAFFMLAVSLSVPFIDERIKTLWFGGITFFYLLPLPIVTLFLFIGTVYSVIKKHEFMPFLLSIGIFLCGYIGLVISLYPWLVPFAFTLSDAAAAPESQSMLLVGTVVLLPIILGYTAYSYYVFRGKTTDEVSY